MFSDMYGSLYDIGDPEGDYTIVCVCKIIDDKGNVEIVDFSLENFNSSSKTAENQ